MFALASQESWVRSQNHTILGTVVHAYSLTTVEAESEGQRFKVTSPSVMAFLVVNLNNSGN